MERDEYLHLVKILDLTDRNQERVNAMKEVVKLNPELNIEEQQLLSSSYKKAIEKSRDALLKLPEIISETEEGKKKSILLEKQQKLSKELEGYCNELIDLIESQLLPSAKDSKSKVFYEKLEADYYRYICESKEKEERKSLIQKSYDHYRRALEISSGNLPSYSPESIRLILYYTVFLYDFMEEKENAIKLAQDTYNECSQSFTQNSSVQSIKEAETILSFRKENITKWTKNE